jgi:hypothetical protein
MLEDIPAWLKVPLFTAFLVFMLHNSFHIGEIVATRQALGIWPPLSINQHSKSLGPQNLWLSFTLINSKIGIS